MIGLHIYKEGITYKDSHSSITKDIGKGYYCSISFHKQYDKEVFYEDEETMVFVDGWIFNSENYSTQARFVLELYKRYKDAFVYYLNGQFNIVIANKKENSFLFTNDIFSFRKHYFSMQNNVLCLSPDQSFIRNQLKSYSLNKSHIALNLEQPRIIKIRETFVNEINQIGPCTLINSDIQIQEYSYEEISKKYTVSSPVTPHLFLDQIKAGMKRVHRESHILLMLSGGLDSRFVLELLNELKMTVTGATYGTYYSDEVQISRQVAAQNDISHHICHLEPEDYVNQAEKYMEYSAGLDIFVQSPVYKVGEYFQTKMASTAIIDTGFALDVFLGGTYIDTYDYSIQNRVFSALAIRQAPFRDYYEDRYAMYEYGNYFLMRALDRNAINQHKFYYELSKLQIKNSFDVPLQSTMFDLNLEAEHWKKAQSIQSQKEQFVLDYFQETGKALYHNRYYSDFDMWLRDNALWNNKVKSLFIDTKSTLSKIWLKDETIKEKIDQHIVGKKSHLRDIVKWMSLEMFLQNKNLDVIEK